MKPDETNSGERARNLARDFALRAADHDRHATFPFENFDALKAAGMLGASLSTLSRLQEAAVELIGNPGLSRANQLERHLRDVLCSRIHTPQNDSILVAAGRAAFKAQEQRGERP